MNRDRIQLYKLNVKGPDVGMLVVMLQRDHDWVFSDWEQHSFFKASAVGYCAAGGSESFVGVGTNDGTYIESMDIIYE